MRLDPHFGMLPLGAFEHYGDRRIRLHGGGGIPIVDDVLDAAEDLKDTAVDIVDGGATRCWFGESIFRRLFTWVKDPYNGDPPATPEPVTGEKP